MITLLKLVAGVGILLGVLRPGFAPSAEDCECKAKTDAISAPLAEDCECKAET